jgi:hypothetical protein
LGSLILSSNRLTGDRRIREDDEGTTLSVSSKFKDTLAEQSAICG